MNEHHPKKEKSRGQVEDDKTATSDIVALGITEADGQQKTQKKRWDFFPLFFVFINYSSKKSSIGSNPAKIYLSSSTCVLIIVFSKNISVNGVTCLCPSIVSPNKSRL